jgi:hypothetical protein
VRNLDSKSRGSIYYLYIQIAQDNIAPITPTMLFLITRPGNPSPGYPESTVYETLEPTGWNLYILISVSHI